MHIILYIVYCINIVEKFQTVTILFSDIVTFTNIASNCSPMEVVNMLNDLYERFDEKTTEHDVYKVRQLSLKMKGKKNKKTM